MHITCILFFYRSVLTFLDDVGSKAFFHALFCFIRELALFWRGVAEDRIGVMGNRIFDCFYLAEAEGTCAADCEVGC